MSTTRDRQRRDEQRLHTIGAVCARLQGEFEDISISKIRYLEDQGLLAPKRTRGGYRLFSEEDVERLETILRLQRDEFLPLRVIRQELATGGSAAERKRRRPAGIGEREDELDLAELCERAGIDAELARALEEFGLLVPRVEGGQRLYRESDADIAVRLRPARPLRHRRAPPAHVPQLRRPRGGPARAARRAGAALPKRRAAQGRARRPAGARGGLAGALAAPVLARAAGSRRAVERR